MFGVRPHCLDLTGGKTVGFFSENGVEADKGPLSGAAVAVKCCVWTPPCNSTGYKCHGIPWPLWKAGVVELADTGDLKSPAPQGVYGFDPRLRQIIPRSGRPLLSPCCGDSDRVSTISVIKAPAF
jgi:hypothetical protein